MPGNLTTLHSRSFEQLYKKLYPGLAVYASFYLKNDEAHDVVQEVFLQFLEKESKLFDEKTLNAYLYKAVQNKCFDIIRHRTVQNQYSSAMGKKLLEEEAGYFYTMRNEIEESLNSRELRQIIDNAVETLPPKGKEVFRLYFDHQKSAKEIASIMDISRSTVENHIYSCLKILRLKLGKYILVISGALIHIFMFVRIHKRNPFRN